MAAYSWKSPFAPYVVCVVYRYIYTLMVAVLYHKVYNLSIIAISLIIASGTIAVSIIAVPTIAVFIVIVSTTGNRIRPKTIALHALVVHRHMKSAYLSEYCSLWNNAIHFDVEVKEARRESVYKQ